MGFEQKKIPNIPPVKIDLSTATDMECESCGNNVFVPGFIIKRVSPLISPTGQETIIPVQVYVCNLCNHMNEIFKPSLENTE